MKYFFRAVWLSLRYRWSILAAIVCSLLIALLWGASITTVLPFVKIVFEDGKTAHTWLDEQIDHSHNSIASLQAEIEELQQQVEAGNAEPLGQSQLKLKKARLADERRVMERCEWLAPYVADYAPRTALGTLMLVMSWLVATTVVKGVLLIVSAMLVARVANRTVMDLRRTYFRKALELDQRRIDRLGTSNVMTHLSTNMLMVGGGLTMFWGKTIREPLKMITCLVMAAWISLPLLLLSLFVVPFGAILMHRIARRMKNATQREMGGMSTVFQTLIESYGAIKTVRIFNRERTERLRFKRNAHTLYRMALRMSFYDALMRPISEILGILSIATSILAGAYLVLNQETAIFGVQISSRPMQPATLMLFYAMLAGASDPARKMSEILNVLVRGGAACENLFRTYESPPQVTAPAQPQPMPLHEKSIRFRNVSFAYTAKQLVIRDFSLEIPFGQTLAIVGGNGSGKSTLVNLLARFYDPSRGKILIDNVDLRSMHPKKLRQQMSWVTQDPELFRGTVRENIAYGSHHATEEDIQRACQLARVNEFLPQLQNGLDTKVGDAGKKLSAGQRQRVALARAIIADPRILILDEATSQLDGHTEQLVHQSLKDFLRARTTILITHRASSIQLADRVIVLDCGRIVSDSTPADAAHSPEFCFLFSKSA